MTTEIGARKTLTQQRVLKYCSCIHEYQYKLAVQVAIFTVLLLLDENTTIS
jgi:hypothetical protein